MGKNKIIISDVENNNEEEQTDSKPRFPRLDSRRMKNMKNLSSDDLDDDIDDDDFDDEDLDDDDYDDEDEDDEDDDDIDAYYSQIRHQLSPLQIGCITAGAIVIAVAFLIIGIFIGKNSDSAFIEHFDLHRNDTYIDVIED